ncbi:unnamed protein product [Closterium sp. NIES-54]
MNLPMASEDDRQVAQELGLLLRGTGEGNVPFSQTRYEQVSISGTTGGLGDGSAASAGASLAAQYGMRDQQGAGGGAMAGGMAGGMAGPEGFGGAPAAGGYGGRDYPHRSGSAPPSVEGPVPGLTAAAAAVAEQPLRFSFSCRSNSSSSCRSSGMRGSF